MKSPAFVEVEWDDANSSATDVFDESIHHKPEVIYTRGWLQKSDQAGASVCNERYDVNGKWAYRGTTFVPRALIRKIVTLRKSTS